MRVVIFNAVALSAFGLVACGGGPLDLSALVAVLGLGVGLVAVLPGPGRAGAPMPCDGYESESCDGGYLRTHCCPANAKCNFDFPKYTNCGHDRCVVGSDIGKCPAPDVSTQPAKSEAECQKQSGSWEVVCIDRKVTKACIPPVPTNFTGPARNPPFRTCGDGRRATLATVGDPKEGERCTTHILLEDCFKARGEILPRSCLGGWQKVCLDGKVVRKCLPEGATADAFPALKYVACGASSCAVGTSPNACN